MQSMEHVGCRRMGEEVKSENKIWFGENIDKDSRAVGKVKRAVFSERTKVGRIPRLQASDLRWE